MTRLRAALLAFAALALAAAVSACGSSGSTNSVAATPPPSSSQSSQSASLPGKGKPAVTLGDKNFTEEYILGYLYKDALQAKGFTVHLKPNIGSSELIDKALTSGKIDLYPEYMGVIDTVLAGKKQQDIKSEGQAYNIAKKFEAKRGFTLLNKTPYFNADALATLPPYAQKHHLKTISDLKNVKHWTFGGPVENKTRYEGVVGLHKAYHLHNFSFVGLQEGQNYPALDSGKIDVATVFTTDGQLTQKGKYVVLADNKHIFGFQNVAPVVSSKVLKQQGPAFAQTLNAVSAKLTNNVMQQLNAAVALQKQKPATVANKFLQVNGLL